jgi:hypothetical protein
MKPTVRHAILIAIIAAVIGAVMSRDPIPQPLAYHDFADDRAFLGVPNLLNVVSNLGFLIVGLMGLGHCLRKRPREAAWSWVTLFVGVTLVCAGSAYYHLAPDNGTLVWDRLPMTVGFMGLLVAVLAEHIEPALDRIALAPAVLVGILSVVYWSQVDDLRPYFSVQGAALLSVLAALVLYRGRYSHRWLLFAALLTYGLAIASEQLDKQIYALTFQAMSGHTLKHLLAALALYWIYLLLRRRAPVS